MAKKNVSADFNSFANKVVNRKEVGDILKADAPKGLKRVLETAGNVARTPVALLRLPKQLINFFDYASTTTEKQTTIYVSKDKLAEALAVQGKVSLKPGKDALGNAIGDENVFVNAKMFIDTIRIFSPSKKFTEKFTDAVAKATDYSADVKSGKIVELTEPPSNKPTPKPGK